MTYKVWYRHRDVLEFDIVEDRQAALRRAAAIFNQERMENLQLAGVEDESGELVRLDDFEDYLKGYRLRGLSEVAVRSPKWYVEVRCPVLLREHVEDEWVRYTTCEERAAAEKAATRLEPIFGPPRVRVSPALAVTTVDA